MESEAIGTAASNTDFSLLSLVFDADPVVKLVLLFLLGASIWSWMVIVEKLLSLGGARRKAKQFEAAFWGGR
ncbi:MAG: protein TolQ, partial [Alphaproteobacteria bacterium]|nr:protein TolQ [Alphaproteobacteria bacterium]